MEKREALCDRTCLSKTMFTKMMNGHVGNAIWEEAQAAMAAQRELCARTCWRDAPVVAGRRALGSAMDGAWAARGATSQVGIVDVTCAKCSKVLDFHVLQKGCGLCEYAARRTAAASGGQSGDGGGGGGGGSGGGGGDGDGDDGDEPGCAPCADDAPAPSPHAGPCNINHVGSSKSMEVAGARVRFRRAIMEHNFYYHLLVTDDDSDFAVKARKEVELRENTCSREIRVEIPPNTGAFSKADPERRHHLVEDSGGSSTAAVKKPKGDFVVRAAREARAVARAEASEARDDDGDASFFIKYHTNVMELYHLEAVLLVCHPPVPHLAVAPAPVLDPGHTQTLTHQRASHCSTAAPNPRRPRARRAGLRRFPARSISGPHTDPRRPRARRAGLRRCPAPSAPLALLHSGPVEEKGERGHFHQQTRERVQGRERAGDPI